MRRIVTGHNEEGKSVVSIDSPPSRSLGEDAGGLYEIWNTDGEGFDTKSLKDKADIDVLLSPAKGGTKIRYFQINPIPEGVPQEVIEASTAAAFEKMGAAHHRVDTSRNAAMHETDTIDYIILLKGDVTLILDEEEIKVNPHDIVVQRGTNHAWVNNGTEPALLIAVLIDSSLV
ncbi:cupin domain-containing protein [Gammaproteobacteria bacterium]|jgi:mannose-6-phosphate isomerase-like protein (cupin superfamily)|nr:cupin domain-containing protein [Gammaproteobacteria bacterium]